MNNRILVAVLAVAFVGFIVSVLLIRRRERLDYEASLARDKVKREEEARIKAREDRLNRSRQADLSPPSRRSVNLPPLTAMERDAYYSHQQRLAARNQGMTNALDTSSNLRNVYPGGSIDSAQMETPWALGLSAVGWPDTPRVDAMNPAMAAPFTGGGGTFDGGGASADYSSPSSDTSSSCDSGSSDSGSSSCSSSD